MKHKTVLVTGAAKGIGRGIAIAFAKQGYQVAINYHTSQEQAITLQQQLEQQGYSVMLYQADITKQEEVTKMVKSVVDKFGGIDVLVNNSGIAQSKLFTDVTMQELDKMLAVNLKAPFIVSQEVVKQYMLDQKQGCIINISSMWGVTGASCEVSYSMTKAGLIGMTKALAKELGLSHIRVNAIAPGVIQTDMMEGFTDVELFALKEEIPLDRLGTVEDVAGVATFLASEQAAYITGQVLSPNGGMVI